MSCVKSKRKQFWVSGEPRRRSRQTRSWCGWTTCCWPRGWRGPRRAGAPRRRQRRRRLLEAPVPTTQWSIPITEPNSHRSDKSTTRSWRNTSRHVMSSPPMWWTSCESKAGPGLFPQRRSSGWSVSSTASSAPSRCSSSRARVRPSWSCVPGSWMRGGRDEISTSKRRKSWMNISIPISATLTPVRKPKRS